MVAILIFLLVQLISYFLHFAFRGPQLFLIYVFCQFPGNYLQVVIVPRCSFGIKREDNEEVLKKWLMFQKEMLNNELLFYNQDTVFFIQRTVGFLYG